MGRERCASEPTIGRESHASDDGEAAGLGLGGVPGESWLSTPQSGSLRSTPGAKKRAKVAMWLAKLIQERRTQRQARGWFGPALLPLQLSSQLRVRLDGVSAHLRSEQAAASR